jgi:hypothetical protein
MWSRVDNQEVGLEAAILERVRNSSLVKWFCADNVAGLSTPPKLRHRHDSFARAPAGVRVQVCRWVGERRVTGEAAG